MSGPLSGFDPIWGNILFTPGKSDAGFQLWAKNGLRKIQDLYSGDVLMTFEELTARHNIPRKHFFEYLQLRSFIFSKQHSLLKPEFSPLEELMNRNCNGRDLISSMYNWLVSGSTVTSELTVEAWKGDLNAEISTQEWGKACTEAQVQTANTSLKLLQYNWLMRTYLTPVKLHRFNANIPDLCFKCKLLQGTFSHSIWECNKIRTFWGEVISMIDKILSIKVPMEPKIIILGLYPPDLHWRREESKFITMSILQAKRLLGLYWKKTERPSMGTWIKKMVQCMLLEKITYILRGKLNLYEKIWGPLINYLEHGDWGNALIQGDHLDDL